MEWKDLSIHDALQIPVWFFLLKMLWDAVYHKVPEGFANLRAVADEAHARADVRHAEHMKAQKQLRKDLKKLRREGPKKKTPRVKAASDNNSTPDGGH